MRTNDIPHVVRRAMPYCVEIKPGQLSIMGREYNDLLWISGGELSGIPKRMPTLKMLESWAHGGRDGGIQNYDKEKRTVQFWFYDDAGRPLEDYAKALRSFGLWMHRTCRLSRGDIPVQEWYKGIH